MRTTILMPAYSLLVMFSLLSFSASVSFALDAANSDSLERSFDLIEKALGTTPAEAQQAHGPPIDTNVTTLEIEDFAAAVTRTELIYSDGTLVYDRVGDEEVLFLADFRGDSKRIGEITLGQNTDGIERALGPPHAVRNWVWTYHDGMRRIHIGFDFEGRANRFTFEQD